MVNPREDVFGIEGSMHAIGFERKRKQKARWRRKFS
jgi:hypothetical protein